MTIFSRILTACILPFIIVFATVVIFVNNILYGKIVAFTDEKTKIFATETAKQINDEFKNIEGLIKVISAHLSEADPSAPDAEEKTIDWVTSILKATPYVHCIWISYEPGGFYKNERFSRDIVKSGDTIAIINDLDDDILDDPDEAPWYYYPFTTGEIWFESADYYDYGLGVGSKYTGTVSMPIKRKGKNVGVAGIDMLYENTFRFINERQVPDRQLILILTQDGEIIYSPDTSLLRKSIFDMHFVNKDLVMAHLSSEKSEAGQNGESDIKNKLSKDVSFNIDDISPFFGVRSSMYFHPISDISSDKSKQLFLYVDLPTNALFSEAKRLTKIIIAASVTGLILLALILFFTIRNILKPIKKLTEGANTIANGNRDFDLDSALSVGRIGSGKKTRAVEKDEIHALFAALKKMLFQLNSMDELSNLNEKLNAALKAKSDFLAKMSHEIRTPMNAITGMAELTLRENIPSSAQEHVLTIKQASANLLSIINDILDLSKIESGKLEIKPAKYLLSSLVNDVVSIIKMKVMDSMVRFVVNADSKIPNALIGDETRIRQIMLNILSNAVKYTKSGYISFDIKGETVDDDTVILIIDVIDTGRGIKKEDIEKLFGDFVQLDSANNRGVEGTGLGLAITKNLVNAMGGEVSVTSEFGKGSTFSVRLPQKIRSREPLALVDKPQEKSVLIYERRDNVFIGSLVRTLENLNVNCAYAKNEGELSEKIKNKDYPFVFVNPHLLDDVKKILSEHGSKAKIVLLKNFGNAVPDREFGVIAIPAHSISVANLLNGVSDDFSYCASKYTAIGFNAPDARILVVDDINTNLKVAAGLLAPYKMQIDLAASGEEAISAVKTKQYDAIFMDHMMPEMDGIEATQIIRESDGEHCKTLPIIALTANAVSGTKEMFLKNGFNDFLSKPIDSVKLNSILTKWIPKEKQKPAAENTIAKEAETTDIAIDGVDVKLGLARTGGTVEGYLQTLAIFYKDGREKIEELKKTSKEDNLSRYITQVHALKSASANVGAASLSDAAMELEEAGKRNDRTFIDTHTPELLANMELLLAGINKVIAAEKEKNGQQNIAIDKDALKTALSRLRAAINDIDPDAINDAAKELRKYENSADIGASVETILQNVLDGEYDEAVSLIEQLSEKAA